MSEFKLKFHIEESPNAKSFTFYDITGDYDENTNPGGWGEDNGTDPTPERQDIEEAYIEMRGIGEIGRAVRFPLNHQTANEWFLGVEFNIDDEDSIPEDWMDDKDNKVFKDAAFKFILRIKTADGSVHRSERDFGFYALIKEEVMKQSLSYRPEMQRTKREMVWEKLRLLDNLFYSTETEQIVLFQENLARLKKLR